MNSNPPVTPPELQESPGATTDASQSDASFGDILFQFEQQHQPDLRGGETVQGTVVAITGDKVYIDVGRKMEGLLPLDTARAAGLAKLKTGDALIVTVTGRDEEGYYLLSTQKVEVPKDWSALENAYKEKHTIAGRVVEAGATVLVAGQSIFGAPDIPSPPTYFSR